MIQRLRRRRGFTLIELMIVMAIIAILISIAVPIYNHVITRSRESVLRSNLFTMRSMIDEYTYDKQKAPQTLDDLVSDGYLREVPMDPMTNSKDTWKLIMEDPDNAMNPQDPGIY
ncbi:MAG: type II secretion system protein [Bryobacteraceae bacterium]